MTCGGRYKPVPEMTAFFMAAECRRRGFTSSLREIAQLAIASDMPISTPLTIAV